MEPFSLARFFGGFNIFDGAKLGKLLFYGIIIALSLTIYHKAFEPKTSTKVERIEHQTVYNVPIEKEHLASIQLWKIKLNLF